MTGPLVYSPFRDSEFDLLSRRPSSCGRQSERKTFRQGSIEKHVTGPVFRDLRSSIIPHTHTPLPSSYPIIFFFLPSLSFFSFTHSLTHGRPYRGRCSAFLRAPDRPKATPPAQVPVSLTPPSFLTFQVHSCKTCENCTSGTAAFE